MSVPTRDHSMALMSLSSSCPLCGNPVRIGADAGHHAGEAVHVTCYLKELNAKITEEPVS